MNKYIKTIHEPKQTNITPKERKHQTKKCKSCLVSMLIILSLWCKRRIGMVLEKHSIKALQELSKEVVHKVSNS